MLNDTGKKIERAIIKYLKEIDEYRPVEKTLLITNTAHQYQKYIEYLDLSDKALADDTNMALKLLAAAQKFYVNYTTNVKTLGISAIQRKKLQKQQDTDNEESEILQALARLNDDPMS